MTDAEPTDLAHRRSPMEMTPATFREAGHRLVDDLADFLATLAERPVTRSPGPLDIRSLLPAGGMPEEGADPAGLLRETTELLVGHSLFNGHPRFFGYITSSAAPIGALADMLAASINPNVGGWQLSPVATEIEEQSIRWIAEMLGYPAGGGQLVSGGNVANIACFLAARRQAGGAGLREDGVAAAGRLCAYVSEETHTWVQKASDVAGLGTAAVRWIPVDAERRIDVDVLERTIREDIERGDSPFLLVGTAGTVGTGAVDPLERLAAVARAHGLWFHVDGAYGAFAAAVPEHAPLFGGLAEADSIAVDPHKWLYAPMEAGCVLVRDRDALRDTFSYTPSYYRFTGEEETPRTNFYELGLQNSRGFRALKVWLGLRQVGLAGYREMVGDDIRLARELVRLATETPELDAGPSGLSIATLRFVPEGGRADESTLNDLNEELLARIKASGEAFLSNAVVDGRFYLRACVCNFRTSLGDVRAVPELVIRLGRELAGS